MRTIVLHYHLFKNAGTSVDEILKRNFKGTWVTTEFPMAGHNNTALVETWINDTPDAVAFSSHTMVGPLPVIDGVRIVPVMMLRDPIARIRSAYTFERNQVSDSWGAVLAKDKDLAGYVAARLNVKNDRQCRNFQTGRLATLVPGDAPELDRALTAAGQIADRGILGRVETFAEDMMALAKKLASIAPDFDATVVRANRSAKSTSEISADLRAVLVDANRADLQLLDQV